MTNQTTPAPAPAPEVIADTRWWDWFSAVLVILLLLTASGRLVATRWTDGLGVVLDFVILGTILGMALGRSSYHPILTFLTSVAYGILIIPWRLGVTMSQGIDWSERLLNMIGRVNMIIGQIVNQTDVTDSLLFVLLMACLFWILSVNAGYVLTRYANAWRIILPAGLTLVVIHYYHNCPVVNLRQCVNIDVRGGSSYIAVYMLLSLLLVARIYYIRQMQSWRDRHTFIHSDVGFDLLRVTVVAVVVLMAMAWTVPAFGNKLFQNGGPLKSINRSLNSASKFFSHAFASLSYSSGPSTEYFGQGLYLGKGSEISYAMVLQVDAPQPSPSGGNYYWQARVYDRYENGGWTSNYPFTSEIKAQYPILTSPFIKGRQISTFNFFAYKNLGLLFFPTQVVSVSRPVIVHLIREPDGTPDVSFLELNSELFSGERYQVLSAVSSLTVRELKNVGTKYPDWVLNQYLQLPSSITPRTRALAQQIASGLTNQYEITDAVTQYLRENITYSRVIPAIPANQEPIDWFLFDLKEGFCNYYATAEVILLRSLGIPARLAVGYAQGEGVTQQTPGLPANVNDKQTYQVREKDSHAWPQVFFPDIGWVEFEPTSSIREIVRPSGEVQPETAPSIGDQPTPFLNRPTPMMDEPTPLADSRITQGRGNAGLSRTVVVVTIAVLIGLLDIFILLWRIPMARRLLAYFKRWGIEPPTFIRNWAAEEILPFSARLEGGLRNIGIQPPAFLRQWAIYAQLNPVGRSYLEINRALRRLGALPTPDVTPAERATILMNLIPKTVVPVNKLLFEYQRGIYSSHMADPSKARVASREVRRLSYMTLFARWMDRLGQPIRRRTQKTAKI
jgi:transglutaminase-like putative cysteine protease